MQNPCPLLVSNVESPYSCLAYIHPLTSAVGYEGQTWNDTENGLIRTIVQEVRKDGIASSDGRWIEGQVAKLGGDVGLSLFSILCLISTLSTHKKRPLSASEGGLSKSPGASLGPWDTPVCGRLGFTYSTIETLAGSINHGAVRAHGKSVFLSDVDLLP